MPKLTKRIVTFSKPSFDPRGPVTAYIWDSELKGFGLGVGRAGTKSFVIQYRDQRGRTRRKVIGRFEVSPRCKAARNVTSPAQIVPRQSPNASALEDCVCTLAPHGPSNKAKTNQNRFMSEFLSQGPGMLCPCLAHHANDKERYRRASDNLKADADQGFSELGQKAGNNQSHDHGNPSAQQDDDHAITACQNGTEIAILWKICANRPDRGRDRCARCQSMSMPEQAEPLFGADISPPSTHTFENEWYREASCNPGARAPNGPFGIEDAYRSHRQDLQNDPSHQQGKHKGEPIAGPLSITAKRTLGLMEPNSLQESSYDRRRDQCACTICYEVTELGR